MISPASAGLIPSEAGISPRGGCGWGISYFLKEPPGPPGVRPDDQIINL